MSSRLGTSGKSGEEKKEKQEREENTDDVNFAKSGTFQCCISMLAFKDCNGLRWNGWQFIQKCSSVYFDDCQPK